MLSCKFSPLKDYLSRKSIACVKITHLILLNFSKCCYCHSLADSDTVLLRKANVLLLFLSYYLTKMYSLKNLLMS